MCAHECARAHAGARERAHARVHACVCVCVCVHACVCVCGACLRVYACVRVLVRAGGFEMRGSVRESGAGWLGYEYHYIDEYNYMNTNTIVLVILM